MIGSLYNIRMNRYNRPGDASYDMILNRERKIQLELKEQPVKKWQEILYSRWGMGKPHEIFKVGKPRFFFMVDDDSIKGYLKIDNSGPSFRTVKKHHILNDYPNSFVHMLTITDKHLDINVTNVQMTDKYYEKTYKYDATKRCRIWVKTDPPVIVTYEHTGRPSLLNSVLSRLSFPLHFAARNKKKVSLYIRSTEEQRRLNFPNTFEIELGKWIRLPIDNNKEVDIMSMRGTFPSLPRPFGDNFSDWRIHGSVLNNDEILNIDWEPLKKLCSCVIQHRCKGRRTFGHVLLYSIQDMLRRGPTFNPPTKYNQITNVECWDCGTIINKEFLDSLVTAVGINKGF